MKAKTLGLFGLSVFMLVLIVGIASATIDFSETALTGTGDAGDTVTVEFTITNNFASDLNTITMDFTDLTDGSFTIDSSNLDIPEIDSSTTIDGSGGTLDVTLNVAVPSGQKAGDYTGEVSFMGALGAGSSQPRGTLPITITVNDASPTVPGSFCTAGNPNNNLRVGSIDIENVEGFGTDDDEWYPLDEISVEIEIENRGSEKIEDIEVEWGIFDSSTGEFILELDDESDFDLKDGREKIITLTFKVDDKDLDVDLDELSEGDYEFYVQATGTDTENDLDEVICDSDSETVKIIIEDDFVILDEIQFTPNPVQCGATLQVTADVFNIGDEEQEDVYVDVHDLNRDLGINARFEVGDIDEFEDEKLNLAIKIPEGLASGTYGLVFEVFDDNDDIFENDDDDEASFTETFSVVCNEDQEPPIGGDASKLLISASLQSGGRVGEELVIRSTIVNTGSDSMTYTIQASNFASWATLRGVDPSVINLGPGESIDVTFRFNVGADSAGDQSFNIEALSSGGQPTIQPVSVTIQGKKGGFGGITGGFIGGDNLYLWGIGVLNVILVIIIIIVAIRVAKS